MSLRNKKLIQKFQDQQVVKVISGLNNFQVANIVKKVKAAEIGGASYIDIAANVNILKVVKSITKLPVCVSSIEPCELYKCYVAGADMVEIGNFDVFYSKGIYFSCKIIREIAKETISLIHDANVCITIPHYLLLNEQINLALELENIGIKFVQTEGMSTSSQHYHFDMGVVRKSITKASSALSSSYALSKHLSIPIIASSGIDLLSAPLAIYYGASAVGLGSSINSCWSVYSQAKYIIEVINSIYSSQKYKCTAMSSRKLKMYKINISLMKSIILSK
uniref:Uncharacterized protein ycf23 n=1 Tax=Asparagopsis taxiformis TaxID=260499 RepID=A0A1C9CC47_9FLOR|nr:hypothetical protein Aspa_082 [Asparagopsis taxiformis]AOM65961.1 hypothetical protein Aspa_082 [Asparagopsis taxiformis]